MTIASSVDSINSAFANALNSGAKSAAAANTPGGASALAMNDFLTLMTTQLKNQDPMKPLDSTEFVTQLAQMAQVSGIQSMQSSLSTLSSALLASQAISGASLVGQQVLTSASSAALSAGGSISGAVNVPAGASGVSVAITDASGATVRQVAIRPQQGLDFFTWDGTTDTGVQAPPGVYSFHAIASVGGKDQAPAVSMAGIVRSVSIDPQTNSLTLNIPELGSVPITSVQQIF